MRNTSNTTEEVAATIRREYYRKWRAANKDKVRQHNENYWRRKAEKQLQQNAKVEVVKKSEQ